MKAREKRAKRQARLRRRISEHRLYKLLASRALDNFVMPGMLPGAEQSGNRLYPLDEAT